MHYFSDNYTISLQEEQQGRTGALGTGQMPQAAILAAIGADRGAMLVFGNISCGRGLALGVKSDFINTWQGWFATIVKVRRIKRQGCHAQYSNKKLAAMVTASLPYAGCNFGS